MATVLIGTNARSGRKCYLDSRAAAAWAAFAVLAKAQLGIDVSTRLIKSDESASSSTSAATHTKPYVAVDLRLDGLTSRQIEQLVVLARECGFAGTWARIGAQWDPDHIHMVTGIDVDTPARYQVRAAVAGYNGLGSSGRQGRDHHPKPSAWRSASQGLAWARARIAEMAIETPWEPAPRPGAWRLAPSLVVLRDEINARWPSRAKTHDGTIGDKAHQGRVSGHNPDADGDVTAIDITTAGIDVELLMAALKADERVAFFIYEATIYSRVRGFAPRPNTGHRGYIHISLLASPDATYPTARRRWSKDNRDPWLGAAEADPPHLQPDNNGGGAMADITLSQADIEKITKAIWAHRAIPGHAGAWGVTMQENVPRTAARTVGMEETLARIEAKLDQLAVSLSVVAGQVTAPRLLVAFDGDEDDTDVLPVVEGGE